MIHTISRSYNTPETLTRLLSKITEQIIQNCTENLLKEGEINLNLWERDLKSTIQDLNDCIVLNNTYQDQYRLIKKKLMKNPASKQFDCNEMHIFGKIDLFCRRVLKLIDLFTTLDQFETLSINKLEGMESIIDRFYEVRTDFRSRNHDLLDYLNNKFDRDYVEFNVLIAELESRLQQFVNKSFQNSSSIMHSLNLLEKFKSILHRDTLKAELDSMIHVIFQNYGVELEQVQHLYEKHKHDPPIPRNLPPVAGNITWARHLLHRIEEPMKQFEVQQNVMGTRDAKRVVKMYNKVAKALIEFEFLWYKAWLQSVDQAKIGLQATLIIRHPDDGKLYVNFDKEILQLIREAKCLDRMGIETPESARIVLFQESKFKEYYSALNYALTEYDSIVAEVIPVTAMILVSSLFIIVMISIFLLFSNLVICSVHISMTWNSS
jgi:dynein heavy chain